jgi:hypothetical protein
MGRDQGEEVTTPAPSAFARTAFRVLAPDRRCPVEGCNETCGFGDFACGPEHEDVIADEIARAVSAPKEARHA